ncbi:MAG: hypothetical protein H7141_10840 [Burkholderiales bacterium]|nr:hypothetical protein [Bacteroidia bacterium]
MKTKEINPFLFYSAQLQKLFAKAAKKDNPAIWLHKHGARTPLFMLESLTRLHNKAFDEAIFDKWNSRFKKLEDLLGEIDKYDEMEKEFKANKIISPEVVKYFSVNVAKHAEKFNQRLREKDWLNNKLESFDSKLNEFTVEYNQEYIDELQFSIVDEIDAILNFVLKYDYKFTKLEEHIHEVRRKLRWLSIYAQSLQGLIQLKKTSKKQKTHINYFTKEVLKSSFNKLPAKPNNTAIIEYDEDSFYALSWLIEELGILKDEGLKVHELKDALFISEKLTEDQANDKAITILGFKKTIESDILKQASEIIKTAISKDKILDKLVIG